MGIFPFEDVPNYSPYIHTGQDLVGPSVNSPEMAATFIQANLASVVSLSHPHDPVGIEQDDHNPPMLYVYPNPAKSVVTFRVNNTDPVKVDLFSINGKKITSFRISSEMKFDITSYPAGIYVLRVSDSYNTQHHRLLIAR